jgi:hypothetical protein
MEAGQLWEVVAELMECGWHVRSWLKLRKDDRLWSSWLELRKRVKGCVVLTA